VRCRVLGARHSGSFQVTLGTVRGGVDAHAPSLSELLRGWAAAGDIGVHAGDARLQEFVDAGVGAPGSGMARVGKVLSSCERYLFIRLLDACNAGCFMCGFAHSADPYRFSLSDFERLLPSIRACGISYVRFTGGEPLLHRDLEPLLSAGCSAGLRMSLITNGWLLPRMVEHLVAAGLEQVIVSIDGSNADSHDRIRRSPGLFARGASGLIVALERGLRTRVNTVVGPHNYREMPALQTLLTGLGVQQWELSAIKPADNYPYNDPGDVVATCEPIYNSGGLVPMGKRFFGDSVDERRQYFGEGITPRPSGHLCYLVGDVVYLDARSGRGYGCSLLAHRDPGESGGGIDLQDASGWSLDTPAFKEHVAHFQRVGTTWCTGCSTTAAGYSDAKARARPLPLWAF